MHQVSARQGNLVASNRIDQWTAEVEAMPSSRTVPMTLEALRDSQRQCWKQKCTLCGSEPGVSSNELHLRARVRELESQLRQLEAQLATQRS